MNSVSDSQIPGFSAIELIDEQRALHLEYARLQSSREAAETSVTRRLSSERDTLSRAAQQSRESVETIHGSNVERSLASQAYAAATVSQVERLQSNAEERLALLTKQGVLPHSLS